MKKEEKKKNEIKKSKSSLKERNKRRNKGNTKERKIEKRKKITRKEWKNKRKEKEGNSEKIEWKVKRKERKKVREKGNQIQNGNYELGNAKYDFFCFNYMFMNMKESYKTFFISQNRQRGKKYRKVEKGYLKKSFIKLVCDHKLKKQSKYLSIFVTWKAVTKSLFTTISRQ